MQIRRWASIALTGAVTATALATAQPAQAAVPDRFGFALFSAGVVSQQFPAATTVASAGVPGRWVVRFPGQGIPGGVVHVTAVHDALANPPGRWCQAEWWGPVGVDEVVRIACYNPAGALDGRPGFSVMFSRSSGPPAGPGHYGYIHSNPAGAILTQYNSMGAANTVSHVGVGVYSISLPALGTPGNGGNLQVTAVNAAAGARCKVAGWSSSPNGQFVRIYSFNPAGATADNAFTVSFQYRRSHYGPVFPPNRFGYLWNQPPPGPAATVFNSSGGAVGFAAGPPVWTVSWANIAATPGNTQVTAYGVNPNFCGLHAPWVAGGTTLFARVNCFTNAGMPINTGFFVTYSSRF